MNRDNTDLSIPDFNPIAPLIPEIKEYGDFVDKQIQRMETDFAEVFKMFYETTNLAKSYMKEQIRAKYKLVDKKRKNIEFMIDDFNIKKAKYEKSIKENSSNQNESFWGKIFGGNDKPSDNSTINSGEGSDPHDMDFKLINSQKNQIVVLINELSKDIIDGKMAKVYYKQSDKACRMYEDLKKFFYKYSKDMYRKFKRFLEPEDTLNNPVINPDLSDLLSHTEKLNQAFKKVDKTNHFLENEDITFRRLPDFLPKLESMPLNNNPNVQKAIESYGPFDLGKEFKHETYTNLVKYPPIMLQDGSIYEGEWKENKRVGKGKSVFKDQTIYEGYWVNDRPGIVGRIITKEGHIYEGYIKNGLAHGKGVYVQNDGYRYVGFWYQDQKHGQGDENHPNGTNYKGEFFYGKHQGHGRIVLTDGSVYEGEFQDDRFAGEGSFTWTNGEKYEGIWCDDKKHGYGIYTYKDGSIYEGDFFEDMPHGVGVLKKPDGVTQYKGFWHSGDPKGIAIEIIEEQQTVGQWLDGTFQTLKIFGGLIEEELLPQIDHQDLEEIEEIQNQFHKMDIPDEQTDLNLDKIAMDVRGSIKQGVMGGLKTTQGSNDIQIENDFTQ